MLLQCRLTRAIGHVRKGWEDRIPRTAEDFENAYRSSIVARQTLLEIDEYEKTLHIQREAREKAMTEATRRKNYQVCVLLT